MFRGAYQADPNDPNSGESYVIYGRPDVGGNKIGTAIDLAQIAGDTGGFVISGEGENDHSGYSVSDAGDVNGDGNIDLIVGNTKGQICLLFLNEFQKVDSVTIYDNGDHPISSLSEIIEVSLATIPDVDNDGIDEVLISGQKPNGQKGLVWILNFDDFGNLDYYGDSINYTLEGLDLKENGNFGFRVSYLGDLDGDEYPEIGIGEPNNSDSILNGGAIYIVSVKEKKCVSEECVWPGDANSDGIANNKDLINIGMNYKYVDKRKRRVFANNNWDGQYSVNWINDKYNANQKHSDCNGDGLINVSDRDAIYVNYNFSHQKTEDEIITDPNGPLIYISADKDSFIIGDTVRFNIDLGEIDNKANNIYGVAMSLRYSLSSFNYNSKASADFSGSWLGTDDNDIITFAKQVDEGIDIAISRTNYQNKSGSGHLASIDIITPDNLGEIVKDELSLDLTDVLIISYNEDTILPDYQSDPIDIIGVSIESIFNEIEFYPNPTLGLITLRTEENIETLKIIDMQGRTIFSIQPKSNQISLDISFLSQGNYILVAESISKRYLSRITKK